MHREISHADPNSGHESRLSLYLLTGLLALLIGPDFLPMRIHSIPSIHSAKTANLKMRRSGETGAGKHTDRCLPTFVGPLPPGVPAPARTPARLLLRVGASGAIP